MPIGPDPDSGLWEFAHLMSGEPAKRGERGQLVITEETGVVLVLLKGGKFWMGVQSSNPSGQNYDRSALTRDNPVPVHEVELPAFFLSKYEMSQGQWERFVGANPSVHSPPSHPDWVSSLVHPVEDVSWTECQRVMARLGLELPTEQQWEYAARAGSATPWWTGESEETLAGAVNLADQAAAAGDAAWPGTVEWLDDHYVAHAPVNCFRANPFGLHNVHGNVWEWCQDWYVDSDSTDSRASSESRTIVGRDRAIRGGSFFIGPGGSSSADRVNLGPEFHDYDIGLRPARALDP